MPAEQKVIRKLSAILSADVKGYSILMTDDEGHTIETLKSHRQIISTLINEHSGRVVDSPGDNILAEFRSVVDAVNCAVNVQRKLKQENSKFVDEKKVQFRIGVNIGDVIQDGNRIYGNGVNVAARIEGLAEPGGVCISRNAYNHIRDKLDLGYEYLGEHSVKNIKRPVRVYKVLMNPEDAGKLIGVKAKPLAKRWVWPLAAAIVVLLGIGAWQFYQKITTPEFEPASVDKMAYPLPDKPSIAVLPFDNMTGDADQEYFSDGITEHIISGLSMVPNLFVVARNSTFTYKGKPVKIQKVAEDLGVQYVLEGSVQKSDNRVRITAQLIDAISGHHIWSERYDRELKDIFKLQDDITKEILNAMQVKVIYGDQGRLWQKWGTDNIKAYLKSLQGANILGKASTKQDYLYARQLFEEAIALDHNYIWPYVNVGWTHFWEMRFGWSESPEKSIQKAAEYANKVISIDESMDTAHALLAVVYFFTKQYEKALAKAEYTVTLNPNGPFAHMTLSGILGCLGRWEESIVYGEKSIRLNPYPMVVDFHFLGRAYFMTNQYQKATQTFKKAVDANPNYIPAHAFLAACYSSLGRETDAAAEAEKVLSINPKFTLESYAKTLPYKKKSDIERYISALRKAGLPDTSTPALPDKPSIAVLPFTNMSDDKEQEYFSDGMTDELIGDLAKIKDIFVISRNSAFTYKGKSLKVQQIAKELNVRYILEGSVQRSGEKVRIRAQLIDGKTDHHLWSESYDGVMDDIFELQDKITGKIVSELAVKLSSDEQKRISSRGTDNRLAYEAFLKGREHYYKFTPDDFIKAVDYFEQAIKIDPNYSRAYAALGMTYNSAWDFGFIAFFNKFNINYGTARLKAIHYLKLAMRNPTYEAYSFAAEVELHLRNYKKMINYVEKAISIAPNAADANLLLGRMFLSTSRPEKAIEYCNIAIKLDPISIDTFAEATIRIGIAYFHLGNYEQAVEFIEKALAIKPKIRQWHSRFLAASYAFLGRNNEAKKALEDWLKYWPSGNYPSLQNIYGWWQFKNEEVFDRLAKGLVKAGFPGDPSDYVKLVEENKLTGKEIKETLHGNKIEGILYENEWWIEFDKQGIVRLNYGKEYSKKGKFWIEDDMLCTQYEKRHDGLINCGEIYRNPGGNAETKNEYLNLDYLELIPFSIVD